MVLADYFVDALQYAKLNEDELLEKFRKDPHGLAMKIFAAEALIDKINSASDKGNWLLLTEEPNPFAAKRVSN